MGILGQVDSLESHDLAKFDKVYGKLPADGATPRMAHFWISNGSTDPKILILCESYLQKSIRTHKKFQSF